MKKLLLIPMLVISISTLGQSLSKAWKTDLSNSLSQFKTCTTGANSEGCHKFSGESVQKVYGVNDFFSKEMQRYMLIDEIYDYLVNSSHWELLGKGYEQDALSKGQQYANDGRAVVAVKKEKTNDYGHMAIILPGELGASGSWGLRVPNAASFFTHQISKSFINQKLSYAFTPRDQGYVLIYARK